MGMPEWVIMPRGNFQTSGCTILTDRDLCLLADKPKPFEHRLERSPLIDCRD